MERFLGMMPSSEIEKEVQYKDHNGYKIIIQAGPNGWTILWAGSSSTYQDIESTTEENFNAAYNKCVELVGEIEVINTDKRRVSDI